MRMAFLDCGWKRCATQGQNMFRRLPFLTRGPRLLCRRQMTIMTIMTLPG
jgi:hypothetical protein